MTQPAKRRSVPERGWLPINPTHYERLGVNEAADATEIGDTIARALAKATPLALAEAPDAQVPQTDRDWQLACEVLADPLRREVYDRYLARERGQATSDEPRRPGRLVWLVIAGAAATLLLLFALFRPTAPLPTGPADAAASAAGDQGARTAPVASAAPPVTTPPASASSKAPVRPRAGNNKAASR